MSSASQCTLLDCIVKTDNTDDSCQELQERVDSWIAEYGVRYFDILTNIALSQQRKQERWFTCVQQEAGDA